MRVFFQARLAYKDGASIQMGYASYVRGAENWVSSCWGEDPLGGTTGHLQSSVCRLQAPADTGAHNACFQRVQDDMGKARSVCRDWEFVSKRTEISLGKFVSEYFTPLTLDLQTGVVSTEDTDEIWEAAARRLGDKQENEEDCSA
jgi:hypothetical protein